MGSVSPKERGELVEMKFQYESSSRGFVVSKPYGDNQTYDFITDADGTLNRVQVKTITKTTYRGTTRYNVSARHSYNKSYSERDCDFLVAYSPDFDMWYIIPITAFKDVKKLQFFPHNENSTGKYEKYLNQWSYLADHPAIDDPIAAATPMPLYRQRIDATS